TVRVTRTSHATAGLRTRRSPSLARLRLRLGSAPFPLHLLDTLLRHPMGNERERPLREPVRDDDGLRQRRKPKLDPRRIAGEHRGDRLAGQDFIARLHGDDEPDRMVDAVLDLLAAAAERDDRAPDGARLDARHGGRLLRLVDLDGLRLRPPRPGLHALAFPALPSDPL